MIMKKLIFGLIATFLIMGGLQAQDVKKIKKEASKALSAYRLDNTNKEKMTTAVESVKQLMGMDIPADEAADAYIVAGDVYNELVNQIMTSKQLGLNTAEDLPTVKYVELKAYDSYKKALAASEKKYQVKAAVKGIRNAQNFLQQAGIDAYTSQDYGGAYNAFKSMIESHELLTQNEAESGLSDEANLKNAKYLTGLAAYNSNQIKIATDLFTELYNNGSEEPAVYEYLYKINAEDDLEGAYKYLEEGREKFPEEVSILFAEINHYLKLGQSDKLIDKIKLAIAAEPDNISLYNVLGNTYDNLHQDAAKNGDEAKADEYFGLAVDQFAQAYGKDKDNATAVYSIGQLYYNKAALKTQELQKYASDYSKEGMKKYEEARDAVFEQFDKALPFFQKSEALNPNDTNTLIALKEIYAKKDDLETSNLFKERLETLQGGGKIDAPHFKSGSVDIDSIISGIKK